MEDAIGVNVNRGEGVDHHSGGRKRRIDGNFDESNNNFIIQDSASKGSHAHDRFYIGSDDDNLSSLCGSDCDYCSDDYERDDQKEKRSKRYKKRLHWSKSPGDDAKYSDWKIEVRYFPNTTSSGSNFNNTSHLDPASVSKAEATMTYSVHRSTLGLQSEYFERIFLGGYSESHQQKSTIQLPGPLVTLDHFETVLEFCYKGKAKLDPNNVVSIVHLSDYLGIEELRAQAQAYIRRSIYENGSTKLVGNSKHLIDSQKSKNVAVYYKAAKVLAMENLQNAIVHICSQEPEIVGTESALSDMPDIQFWFRLWEERKKHQNTKSLAKTCIRAWSENIAHFFSKHPRIADLQTFRQLTHIDSLSVVSADIAVLLMEQEYRLYRDEIETNPYLIDDKSDTLTCLQTRCVEALYNTKASSWRLSGDSDALRGKLRKLPPIVLESLLLKTMMYERFQQFPRPVVSGAGSCFVNGVYQMSGWFHRAMKFTRWGIYEGKTRLFTLYRYEGEWWISIVPEDSDEPGGCDDIDFYSFDELMDDTQESPLPPRTGWMTCCGKAPAPSVRIETDGDVGEIDRGGGVGVSGGDRNNSLRS